MTETDQQAVEFYNAGLAHMRAGRLAEARACYEHALAIQPGYARALHNLGTVLDDLGDPAGAEKHFRAAIAADETAAEPWAGLGSNLRGVGQLEEARAAYLQALILRPDFPAVRWNLALIDLAEGRFADGWTHYLFRQSVDRRQARLAELPRDLSGTVIEIIDEQGLGDALFFLRFAPLVYARGGIIRYAPDPRLAGIVSRMLGNGPAGVDVPTIRVALGDLPFLLGATTYLAPLPVSPLPDRMIAIAAALRAVGRGPYVGVTWRAGQRVEGWLFKEAPLDQLGAALREAPGTLVSVQRAPEPAEHARLEQIVGRRVADFSAYNDDLEDMLALMTLLDLYVGVSNTNIHLRTAAQKNAHVLVTNPAEYRWMASGDRSPWFPGCDLYRQAANGSWDEALARLAKDLHL